MAVRQRSSSPNPPSAAYASKQALRRSIRRELNVVSNDLRPIGHLDGHFGRGKEKGVTAWYLQPLDFIRHLGRRERIRTSGPLHPMQVRYQAALHADKPRIITRWPAHAALSA
jgi:hypothetical protein